MATIIDVSRRAGVSKTTVSRVMNGKGRISQSTRDAVFKAIKELDYRPNVLAQSLSNQMTNSIGLILPSGYHRSQYIMGLMDLAHSMAANAGKFLIITQTTENTLESGIRSIRELVDRQCDGILYYKTSHIETSEGRNQLIKTIDDLPIPLVMLNYKLEGKLDQCVWFDHVETGYLAINKLIEFGHRQIAYLCGPQNINTGRQRFEGYRLALAEHDIEYDPRLVVEARPFLDGGFEACETLLKRNVSFSAISCYNDPIAIGTLKALLENGKQVPQDISVFGFDNEDIASYTQPTLCSVQLPVREIVERACNILFARMSAIETQNQPVTELHSEVIMRDSVRRLI
ncbi:LacI family transcriptional regulator [Vibrio sp.]|uniref:LacI family transcriptional regulator n=1 Tax=Vibrio viridaestus TaxID=2487322 RepID=A0A3N9TKL7_9VIBR|nr:LacI family DNA-binding transcriptional regulator [Vibrio viridaestus]MDC0611754.1 LacI family transcriptional regulator [Vibrio sp.]RQW64534.1 LacI family transcriptional regulator [Vibrio viridaestus]